MKKFALFGKLQGFSIEGAKLHIEMNGGKVVEHVAQNTDYLVTDAKDGETIATARALGVKVIDAEILDMMFDMRVENGVIMPSAFDSGSI